MLFHRKPRKGGARQKNALLLERPSQALGFWAQPMLPCLDMPPLPGPSYLSSHPTLCSQPSPKSMFPALRKRGTYRVPLWHSGLRTWHCYCSGSDHCCGGGGGFDPRPRRLLMPWTKPKKKRRKKSLTRFNSMSWPRKLRARELGTTPTAATDPVGYWIPVFVQEHPFYFFFIFYFYDFFFYGCTRGIWKFPG